MGYPLLELVQEDPRRGARELAEEGGAVSSPPA